MNRLPRIAGTTAALMTLLAGSVAVRPAAAAAESAQSIYTRALARERDLRDASNAATLPQLRRTVNTYESLVRQYPTSGYADNALWQAGNLALLAYERFREPSDRRTAVRLFTLLKDGYPSSSLAARAIQLLGEVEADPVGAASTAPPVPPVVPLSAAPAPAPVPPAPVASGTIASGPPPDTQRDSRPAEEAVADLVTIRDIKRTSLPDGIRVTIEMDRESMFRAERLENPRRVFFDLKGSKTVPSLQDATLKFTDDIVREIRLGRHPRNTTRVVMDMESAEGYSVFTLYNPFRLVVDIKRAAVTTVPPPAAAPTTGTPPAPTVTAEAKAVAASKEPVPPVSRAEAPSVVSPAAPTANSNGQFSLSRQLGLGISRIVLDAGHGGHDPGARANGVSESELVLDVTLRLRTLLEKQPGIEVTLTRDGDVFIPLEERTAIANRQGADLFLSIHANASRNAKARGIETYFLNFATNPEAEAVAARENSGSGQSMHNLTDIVRTIALNNKIDESRDFASMVQKAMVRRLATRNNQVRDLGVKQAPFVVLIGAGMPSVLAEISFITNKQESALLKTAAYRQQIAESLLDGILRYQRALKGVRAVAARE